MEQSPKQSDCRRCDGTGKMQSELRGFEHCTSCDGTGKQSPAAVEPVAWQYRTKSVQKAGVGWVWSDWKNGRVGKGYGFESEERALYSAASLSQLSTKLENAERERDEARRKLFPHADANPICGFSYGGFYFISDEKGIAEFRRLENNANQISVWRREFDIRIEAAEAKLAEARAAALEEAAQIADPQFIWSKGRQGTDMRRPADIAAAIRARAVKGAGQS